MTHSDSTAEDRGEDDEGELILEGQTVVNGPDIRPKLIRRDGENEGEDT